MKTKTFKKHQSVRDLQDEKYMLVQDSQEIDAILDSIGYRCGNSIGCLLVEVLDGEYGEVWAIDRYIPYLNERTYQIN